MHNSLTGLAALSAACLLLLGCGQGDPSAGDGDSVSDVRGVTDDEIVIGSHTDLVGPTAIWGVGSMNGVRMRFDEANAAGGVHGRTIRFVVEDAQYQVPRAIQAANKLINRDRIFIMLLGMGTPMNNAVMTQQFEAGVPNIFPLTGARSMVEPLHPMKFTQRGIYYDEIRAAVRYFVEERDKERVCVVYQDTEYGEESLEAAEDQLEAMSMPLVETTAHHPTQTEFTAAILRLRRADCDLVLMGTVHRDTILVLDAARKMGWNDADWVGNNATYAQAIADSESAEGYYAFVHMARLYADDDMSPEVREWWDTYVSRFDAEPDLAAMEGYRAADVVVLALERAGRELTTEKFLQALESIDDYTDIFGYRLSFGPERHSGAQESVLSQVRDGRWVKLEQSISY
ncbi:MAG: ABC transporter substrate-binding protein [Gammaproteobacteria bacterium]|nr:ABC transporter substrate-binding protein [Gammaproteobacteria bacterium]